MRRALRTVAAAAAVTLALGSTAAATPAARPMPTQMWDLPLWWETWQQPREPSLTADIVSYSIAYATASAGSAQTIGGADTIAASVGLHPDSDTFSEIHLRLDTDHRGSTGCGGYEYIASLVDQGGTWDVELRHHVEDAPLGSCTGTALPGAAVATQLSESIAIKFTAASVGDPISFTWQLEVVGSGDTDVAPETTDAWRSVAAGWHQPFTDVSRFIYYGTPVAWLRQAGLTTGVGGSDRYEPNALVTRAELATFLHRIAGAPSAPPAPFVDVSRNAFYTAAVDHLYAEGLTTGVGGSNRFEPHAPLTRAEIVTFLWRAAGSPDLGYPDPGLSDVTDPHSFFYRPVAWAVATGVTTGVGSTGTFQPHATVTRAEVATFLFRAYVPLD